MHRGGNRRYNKKPYYNKFNYGGYGGGYYKNNYYGGYKKPYYKKNYDNEENDNYHPSNENNENKILPAFKFKVSLEVSFLLRSTAIPKDLA